MLDLKWIRENPGELKKALSRRGSSFDLDGFLRLDQETRKIRTELERLRGQVNRSSEEVGRLKRQGGDIATLTRTLAGAKENIRALEKALEEKEAQVRRLLLEIPNPPDPSVPDGTGPQHNRLVREGGKKPTMDFQPKDHQDLGEALGILDLKQAAKLSGSRFTLLKGRGAALMRALIRYMLEIQTKRGYTEVWPPVLVRTEIMEGTGQYPKFEEDLYKCRDDDAWLIPTAEVPLANLHRQETIPEEKLPLRYCAYTACFRREAGSYGKDTRGMIRVHQFDKVELVSICRPEDSERELQKMTEDAEAVLKGLGLPYRVMLLCSGDMGFASAKTYDLEVWMPGEDRWREVSSVSDCGEFQARRMGTKYRTPAGARFVHTLNGSGVAVGRTLAALLENFQRRDGSVEIPEPLQPFAGFSEILPPER